MSLFRSAFVALVLVIFTIGSFGCAGGGGNDSTSKAYCESVLMTSPSCIVNTPSPGGTSLIVPTSEIRPKMDDDPSRDFPAIVQLVSLSPNAGVVQNGTFPFSPSVRVRIDDLGLRGGNSVNYWLYPSNDGETESGPEFGAGYVYIPNTDQVFGTGGMFMMMPTPFKYILVKMKTHFNTDGDHYAHTQFKVDYTQ